MAKNKAGCIASVVAMALGSGFLMPTGAWADECATLSYNGTCYASLMEAFSAVASSGEDGTITLMGDMNDTTSNKLMWSGADFTKTTLDLNGHDLTLADGDARIAVWANEFDIVGDGTLSLARDLPFAVIGSSDENDAGKEYTVLNIGQGVTLNSIYPENDDWYMIPFASNYQNKYGIVVNLDGKITNTTNTPGAGFYVNGQFVDADININMGSTSEITAKEGAYIAGCANVKFAGTINADSFGIEIRAGELTVSGGSINVNKDTEYTVNPNGNGSTTTGAAIAVVQHTTLAPLEAKITGGTFTAPVALSEKNPQENPREAIDKVKLSVTGGDFIATNGDPIVASEDVGGFISGGVFNKQFDTAYLAEGYSAYEKPQDVWTVDRAEVADLPTQISIAKGETYTLEPGEVIAKYLSGGILDGEIASLEGLTITGLKAGETTLTLQLYEMGKGFDTPILIYVYDLDNEDADVRLEVEAEPLDENDIDSEVLDALEEAAGEKKAVAFYDIVALVYAGDVDVDELHDIEPTKIVIAKPTNLPEVAKGFIRKFFMIRFHEGETDVIEMAEEDDGLAFFNDKFSTFMLVYEDVLEPEAPETGTVTVAGGSAIVASAATAVAVGVITTISSFAILVRRREIK